MRSEGASSEMVREKLGTPNIHAYNAVLKKGMEMMAEKMPKEVEAMKKKNVEMWFQQPSAM
eukprot:4346478-Karenia_brevis.AAC.1